MNVYVSTISTSETGSLRIGRRLLRTSVMLTGLMGSVMLTGPVTIGEMLQMKLLLPPSRNKQQLSFSC